MLQKERAEASVLPKGIQPGWEAPPAITLRSVHHKKHYDIGSSVGYCLQTESWKLAENICIGLDSFCAYAAKVFAHREIKHPVNPSQEKDNE